MDNEGEDFKQVDRDNNEDEDNDDDDDNDDHGGITELVRDYVGEIFGAPLLPEYQL